MPDHFDDLRKKSLQFPANRPPSTTTHLRNEYERHAQKTTENDGQRDEGVTGVLLTGDDHPDGSRDETEDHHVVYAHSHVSGVVDLLHFYRSSFVRQEQAEHLKILKFLWWLSWKKNKYTSTCENVKNIIFAL